MVKVHHCYGGYSLPDGLPDGSLVRLVGLVQAYRLVEWEGELFEVHMANVDVLITNGHAF